MKNLGLELLRAILCFWIVICHSCKVKNIKLRHFKNLKFHVPGFMIISFYFCFKNLSQRNIKKIKLRFERLLIPYIIWPILILFINNILISLGFNTIYKRKFKIYDLILQYTFGRHIHTIFWFQFQILIITLYFSIISFAFPNNYLSILYFSLIISYFLQYSGINFKYFSQYKDSNYRNVGSIVEILPLAVTGIIFGSINNLKFMFLEEYLSIYMKN